MRASTGLEHWVRDEVVWPSGWVSDKRSNATLELMFEQIRLIKVTLNPSLTFWVDFPRLFKVKATITRVINPHLYFIKSNASDHEINYLESQIPEMSGRLDIRVITLRRKICDSYSCFVSAPLGLLFGVWHMVLINLHISHENQLENIPNGHIISAWLSEQSNRILI
jgi:hypothetical protein